MAKNTKTDPKLSEVELRKLSGLEQRRGQLQRAGADLDREYRDTLDLIGDRYGKDLLSGNYNVTAEGLIVEVGGKEQSEAQADPEQQQLNG
jgi:hypothetical protein